MPAFAWLAFCSFAGAFRKQRARRSRRSSRLWRAEWDSRETIYKYPLPYCQLLPSLSAGACAFFENVQSDWGGDFVLPAGDNATVYPDPKHDGVFGSERLEVMREGTEDYELPTESARSAPGRRRGNDASISNLSGRFFGANGGIVDDGPCPEANAEDKPKRNVEKCKAAAQSREVSDAPNDHRHHGSAYDSRTQNAREGTVELRDRIERKRHNADDIWDNGTKNISQQGDHEKSKEHQVDRVAASGHELPFSLRTDC